MDAIDNFIQPIVNKVTHWLMLFLDRPRSFIRFRVYTVVAVICGVMYSGLAARHAGTVLGIVSFLVFCPLAYYGASIAVPADVAAENKGLCLSLSISRVVQPFGLLLACIMVVIHHKAERIEWIANMGFWLLDTCWIYSAATPPNPPAKAVLQPIRINS